MTKLQTVINETENKIISGFYGKSGERFLSVRDFSKQENIAYKTAYAVFQSLERSHHIFLIGQIWYLSYALADKNSTLRKNRNEKLIGIHIKEINNSYIAGILSQIKTIAEASNIDIVIETSENSADSEEKILGHFLRIGCYGAINFPNVAPALANYYEKYPLPLIFVGRKVYTPSKTLLPCVATDNYGTCAHLSKNLYTSGYRNFYYLGSRGFSDSDNERLNGFINGLKGLFDFREEHAIKFANEDDVNMKFFAKKLAADANEAVPTVIFCQHDLYAAKLTKLLLSMNAKIPEEIGIIGYDDLPICEYISPTISSVSYSFREIAKHCMKLLFQFQSNNTLTENTYIIPNFIRHRQTTMHQ